MEDVVRWAVFAVFVVILIVIGSRGVGDVIRLVRLGRTLTALRHDDVLRAPLPREKGARAAAHVLQARSACLTGRFALALELLNDVGDSKREARAVAKLEPEVARLHALIGLGRYEEITTPVVRPRSSGEATRIVAQALIELGRDAEAMSLLDVVDDPTPLGEASVLRIRGELEGRRGDPAAGRPLLLDARRRLDDLDAVGVFVDCGYCECHLAEGFLAEGRLDEAWGRVGAALDLISPQQDNVVGLGWVHGVAAEIAARRGAAADAASHLSAARSYAQGVDSPPMCAQVAYSEGAVALALGDRDRARQLLGDASRELARLRAVPPDHWRRRFTEAGVDTWGPSDG